MQFELSNVDKVYVSSEENKVFGAKNVNIKVLEGEFMALVGPSGSGKTTILNLIAGLILPTTGLLKHGGQDITSMSLEERTKHRLDYTKADDLPKIERLLQREYKKLLTVDRI